MPNEGDTYIFAEDTPGFEIHTSTGTLISGGAKAGDLVKRVGTQWRRFYQVEEKNHVHPTSFSPEVIAVAGAPDADPGRDLVPIPHVRPNPQWGSRPQGTYVWYPSDITMPTDWVTGWFNIVCLFPTGYTSTGFMPGRFISSLSPRTRIVGGGSEEFLPNLTGHDVWNFSGDADGDVNALYEFRVLVQDSGDFSAYNRRLVFKHVGASTLSEIRVYRA